MGIAGRRMAGSPCLWAQCRPGTADRDVWVKTLVRLVDPVLSNLANETLKKRMPYQSLAPTGNVSLIWKQ